MTREQLDKWIANDYNKIIKDLRKKYPSVKTIVEDFNEYYLHVIDRLHTINCPKGYLYAFIYNRNFRYFKKEKIDLEKPIPEVPDEPYDMTGDRVLDIIDKLELPEKILYDLYYVQGLTTRVIGDMHGISHTGVAKQLKKLQKIVKNNL